MTDKISKIVLIIAILVSSIAAKAQKDSISTTVKKEDRPLKFNLNDDGSHFFQVTFLNQTWVRVNESNPGTTVMGETKNNTLDIGLRRTRIQMFGQITDRAFIYFQYGMNNFNFLNGYTDNGSGNRKIAAFFHDALGEYRVTKGNQLKLGGGLTIANGLSRFSNPSVGTIMALDVPVFAQATVDQTDEFSRKLSVYARGQVHKFDYRMVLSDPFPFQSSGKAATINADATFAGKRHHKQYQGYLMYQFFEHEGHLTPYMTGSYLGSKKIFNIAGGIIYQKDAMWKQMGKDTTYQDMLLWSVESFLDMPLNKEKGTAVTAYVGYFNYNFGSNYVRTQAQMNPANGVNLPQDSPYKGSISGSGNGWPMMGTGNIIYSQVGYLLPKNLLGSVGTLQPYATFQTNNFTKLKDRANVYDLGVNWLFKGHKSKLSLDYQNRPVYKNDNTVGTRKGCYILQYQLSI
jgi:hypothetical protein